MVLREVMLKKIEALESHEDFINELCKASFLAKRENRIHIDSMIVYLNRVYSNDKFDCLRYTLLYSSIFNDMILPLDFEALNQNSTVLRICLEIIELHLKSTSKMIVLAS